MKLILLAVTALVFSYLAALGQASTLAKVGYVNAEVNGLHRKENDSCLTTALEKKAKLEEMGIHSRVLVVRFHGEAHAIVAVEVDGAVYYLDNYLNTLATSWYSLYEYVGDWKEVKK